ncbi:MAG: serpin family protein [Candidatus Krumholzibacteria bacterium]|jgi:serpin B|nr:serpin family protein [Candidatus Krumholzibacteria bacterium]
MSGMSRLIRALTAGLAVVGLLPACKESPATANLAEANLAFAWALYGRIAEDSGDDNLFFSPYSVASALGMTLLGARGETARQMQQVLFAGGDGHAELGALQRQLAGAEPVPAPGSAPGPALGAPVAADPFQLTVANALWLQAGYPLRPDFTAATRQHYGAQPFTADFAADPQAATGRINEWVADQTNQRIKDLLAPGSLTPATRLVLANAIYFKAAWQIPFAKETTAPAPFHRHGGGSIEVPLMRQIDRFGYQESPDLQVVRLPYTGRDLAMVVILPRTVDGLPALEASLDAAGLRELIAARNLPPRRVEVHLPRFRLEPSLALGPVLAALGMPAAFTPDRADFSGMNDRCDLFIDAVAHKAFVAVDEAGTEAAAATAVTMMVTSVLGPQDEPIVFRADHPFLFGIVHEPSGTILFLGRLTAPAA